MSCIWKKKNRLLLEFFPNDLEDLERKLRANRLNGGTAAVYLEPMGPESGTRPVSREFVRGAARLARQYGALLIFDEVVTGFRIGLSGAPGKNSSASDIVSGLAFLLPV